MQPSRHDLFQTVKARLLRERGKLRSIAEQSGVPYPTLTKITSGVVMDPRISTVQALYDYFEQHPDQPDASAPAGVTH